MPPSYNEVYPPSAPSAPLMGVSPSHNPQPQPATNPSWNPGMNQYPQYPVTAQPVYQPQVVQHQVPQQQSKLTFYFQFVWSAIVINQWLTFSCCDHQSAVASRRQSSDNDVSTLSPANDYQNQPWHWLYDSPCCWCFMSHWVISLSNNWFPIDN